MSNLNVLAERGQQRHRIRLLSLGLSAVLCFTATIAFAGCNIPYPNTDDVVTCSTASPNPDTYGVHATYTPASSASTNVTVTIETGASISTNVAAVRIYNNSIATNNGFVSTTGANHAYGIWAGNPDNATIVSGGYGNTLINNGSITTSSAGSPGLYTRTRHATIGNTIINTGAITTSGGTVTSSGRTSSGIRTESRENSTINNSGTITVNGAGGNGIEVMGVGTITNTGTITSAQGCGIVGSYLLQGATYYAGLTLDNAGEISGASCAISLSGGADTVIIRPGAVLTGSIDGGGVSLTPSGQDKLIFNGFLDADFDNTILKFNLLQATGNADVGLTATDYTFDQVQIDADSSLTFIDTTLTVPSGIINNGALTFNNTALSVPSDIVNNGALTFNNSQTVGNLTNNGSINMDTGTVGTQLTTDDYVSDGVFAMNAALDAGSSSDRLIVTGTLTGSTTLYITNFGGAGAQTTGDGILVVDASGAVITPGASFTLAAPLIAGNYQYTLHQGGIGGNNPQNWYLRSTARSSATAIPTLNPAALVLLALALMAVASRIRNRAR